MKLTAQLFVAASVLSSTAYAGGFSPDAGSMLANLQDRSMARSASAQEGFPLEYYPRLRWNDDFSVQVQSIAVEGNTLVPTAKLQVALKGFVGKRIVVERLNTVSAAVTKAYRDAGYRVKAYIPEQSFGQGRLVVQVIEAASHP